MQGLEVPKPCIILHAIRLYRCGKNTVISNLTGVQLHLLFICRILIRHLSVQKSVFSKGLRNHKGYTVYFNTFKSYSTKGLGEWDLSRIPSPILKSAGDFLIWFEHPGTGHRSNFISEQWFVSYYKKGYHQD